MKEGSVQLMENKTYIDAKYFLERVQELFDVWQNKKEELCFLESLETTTTAPLDPNKVQGSSPSDKLGGLISTRIDFEREVVNKAEEDFLNCRDDCIKVLNELQKINHQQYKTLHCRYIEFAEDLKDVAKKIKYSYSSVKVYHAMGIKNVQKILENSKIHTELY